MSFEVHVDYDKAIRVMELAIRICDSDITKEDMHRIGEAAVSEIRSNMQNEGHVVTGGTLASVGIYEESDTEVLIGSDEPSSIILEYGRGPVRPVNAKVLRWIDPKTNEVVFSMYSGPVQPTGVFERGVLAAVPREIDAIAKDKENEIRKVA